MDEKKKLVLMDNRLKADYDKEHITGAVLLTVDELLRIRNWLTNTVRTNLLSSIATV